ncbi:MAG: hypothetical protein KQH79_07485 [Bacteroidetes bacterium]|nr:hypothetical protein [Bacteroidota bacterium]
MKKDEIKNTNHNNEQSDKNKQPGKNLKNVTYRKKDIWSVVGSVVLLILAAALLFLYTENYHKENYDNLQSINSDLSTELAYRDSLINEWITTFNDIEKDLITMQEKEALLKFDSSDPEMTKDVRKRVINELKQINTLLKDNKAKIASLNQKLKKSGVQIAALKKKVIQLEDAVEQRDRSIADLKVDLLENNFKLQDLNQVVDSLDYELIKRNEEIVKKDQEIKEQRTQLTRGYYALGNQKELKEKGLMKKEGGFLGLLGKSKTVSPSLSEDQFNTINIDQTNRIAINSKKAKIISDHPRNSFEFVSNDSLIAYIEIKNPDEFWKITKYAVIETNK